MYVPASQKTNMLLVCIRVPPETPPTPSLFVLVHGWQRMRLRSHMPQRRHDNELLDAIPPICIGVLRGRAAGTGHGAERCLVAVER